MHRVPLGQQIVADMMGGSNWLFEFISHIRDGMKLVHNGFHSSMEYNAANMIASSHLGRSLVLNHCTEEAANWKEQLLQSKYNEPHLFGVLSNSAHLSLLIITIP